ncbi:hypothetical protein [Streptomyces sp. NPDC058240]|uniref:hypothetical protein n=1 Tax=Streptomyces sp. NPDC058240 TaxID=3346396 RepID=UPI0036DFBCE7
MAGRVELVRAAGSGPDGVRGLVVRWNGEEFVVTEPGARPLSGREARRESQRSLSAWPGRPRLRSASL